MSHPPRLGLLALAVFSCLCFFSCASPEDSVLDPSAVGSRDATATPSTPDFDGELALGHLVRLVERGQRFYAANERAEVLEELAAELEDLGALVEVQRFAATEALSGARYELANVLARIRPEKARRLLLATHWDTRSWAEEDPDPMRRGEPIPGANDGTSGLSVLLELVRAQRDWTEVESLGLDLVLFDGEELGRPGSDDYGAGSRYFADRLGELYPHGPPVAAIVVDMVGKEDLVLRPEGTSLRWAPHLVDRLWAIGARYAPAVFVREPVPPIFDDHTPLALAGVPAVLLIDLDDPTWHTHADTAERCSAASLDLVGTVLLELMGELGREASDR